MNTDGEEESDACKSRKEFRYCSYLCQKVMNWLEIQKLLTNSMVMRETGGEFGKIINRKAVTLFC